MSLLQTPTMRAARLPLPAPEDDGIGGDPNRRLAQHIARLAPAKLMTEVLGSIIQARALGYAIGLALR